MKGTVLKIDRGSKHDGPGIRTVVFLKGCPLRCMWCSTPDSQELRPQLLHVETFCTACGRCAASCPQQALSIVDGQVLVDRSRCVTCGTCVDRCLNNGMKISGTAMTVEEVFEIVRRQIPFWTRMQGGLTISGGEVFSQYEFALLLLKRCHEEGIDTNIESSCYTSPERIASMLPYLDHVCCDVKHMDDETHKRLTGVSNVQILDNIRRISMQKDLILRYPVIPGCNDSDENVDATAAYIRTLGRGFNRIDLLAYHEMGTVTYQRLGREYPLKGCPPMERERMIAIRDRMREQGVNAVIA
ncbi:glycyl-radical enzyme activating protein [Mailhella sp.]|uniref:glycyl-radical enzyme activating protein n=1 Tax=Mailhella sp. TaxID=1981029 RepID=UPI0040638A6D